MQSSPSMFKRALPWLAAMALTACGSSDKKHDETSDAASDADASAMGPISFEPAVACDDKAADLYDDPGKLPAERGAILRCVDDGTISKAEIAKRLASLKSDSSKNADGSANPDGVRNTYKGPPPQSGSHVYRVLYRTERGNGAAGYAVATIYAPEVEGEARRSPLMLLARGSRGQAPKCAPSVTTDGPVDDTDSPDGRYVQDDLESMLWPLVTSGFAVVVTDSAGYANFGAKGNPPSGYADIEDMGKSFLDSGVALKKMFPDATTDEILMTGLSQGGHTVLGSLDVAKRYAPPGKIVAAAVYSPLWFSQRAWGAVMSPVAAATGLVLNKTSAVPVSIWYHYTHAEMYDGPGAGVKLFKPAAQAAVKKFMDTTCWSRTYEGLAEKGRSAASDFFSEELVNAVSSAALSAGSCDGASNEALCQKWMDRYRADHPLLTGTAAEVPVLVAYGLKDTTISPARFKCAVDKLRQGKTPLTFCIDPNANHAGIILAQSQYVNEWLRSKVFGTSVTAKCPANQVPAELECDPLLPNDPVK